MTPIKKIQYSDILGWSVSRYDRFSNCKRQYFYDYYAKYDSDNPLEKIQFLKNMTSKPLETGNIVHDLIRDVLFRFKKTSKAINLDKFLKYSLELTNRYCAAKTFCESYYGKEVVLPSDLYIKIRAIMLKFFESNRFKWIIEHAISECNNWIIEPDGFGETRIDELKAFCKVDFLFPAEDKIYILDWKTGKQDEKKHSRQLIGYSVWANYHFNKEAASIVPIIAYLFPEYAERKVIVDETTISNFKETVRKETEEMYGYLIDIEKNIPVNKKEFSITDNNFICKYCNYREICSK
jgi:CRISPR/Cas system-associated exonuclease Cas4 (RecB family)